MRKRGVLLSTLMGIAGGAIWFASRFETVVHAHSANGAAVDPAKLGKTTDVPVLVELFTSEGCSSCPPADEVLARLEHSQPVPGARVVPLEFHVDYWDELGWPDPFASPSFTERQRGYATREGRIYTPQAVIDGRKELVGSNANAVERAIAEAALRRHASIEVDAAQKARSVEVTVRVGRLPENADGVATEANVFIALTQSRATVRVLRGENGGRMLSHSAVVRGLEKAGTVAGRGGDAHATLRIPSDVSEEQLRIVVFAQRPSDRQILGSMTRPLIR